MGNHLLIRCVLGLAILFAIIFTPTILGQSEKPPTRSKIRVVYWDIGQGDFISVLSKEACIFFDVGGSFKIPSRALVEMRSYCPNKQGYLFVSHFDKDHISNYKRLMSYINIAKSYFSHLDSRSQFGQKLMEQLKFQNSNVAEIRAGFSLGIGEIKINCLWPPKGPLKKAENDRSLVLKVTIRDRTFLFVGDLSSKVEKFIPPAASQVLKVGHHGSRYSSNDNFLRNISPQMCVVSVGRINTYGHPNHEALRRLAQARCAILRTDKLGTIIVEL